jgi:hypothetical protein
MLLNSFLNCRIGIQTKKGGLILKIMIVAVKKQRKGRKSTFKSLAES